MDKQAEMARHFNLAQRLLSDRDTIHTLGGLMTRLSDLDSAGTGTVSYLAERDRLLRQLFNDSGLNYSLLTGFFFPAFPKGSPMSMFDRPFNMVLMFLLPFWSITLRGSRQIGKALEDNEPVMKADGSWIPIGKIRTGTVILDGNGNPCTVEAVIPQGERPMVRVEVNHSVSVKCDIEHLWKYQDPETEEWRVSSVQEILDLHGGRPYLQIPDGPLPGSKCITEISAAGSGSCTCITVSSEDETFVTRGGAVTHNSTTLGVRMRMASEMIRRYSSLYIAPHTEPLKTFARKFDDVCKGFRYPVRDLHKFKQNMYYRKFPSDAVVEMARVQTSATPVRGKTADELDIDETCDRNSDILIYEDGEVKTRKLFDMRVGMITVDFDENQQRQLDRVSAVVCKGDRHTWRFRTRSGRELVCTSSTRILTRRGWHAAFEFFGKEEASRCEKTLRAKAALRRAAEHDPGFTTWRREHEFFAAAKRVLEREVQGEPLVETGRPLQSQGRAPGRLRQHGGADRSKPGVRGGELRVRNIADPGNVVGKPGVLHGTSRPPQPLEENRNPPVGEPADLGSGGLVVYGRRVPSGLEPGIQHPELLEGGGGAPVHLVPRPGGGGGPQKGGERSEEDLPHSGDPGLRDAEGLGEDQALRREEHALQMGDSRGEVDLRVLRGGLPDWSRFARGSEEREPGGALLHKERVQAGQESEARRELRGGPRRGESPLRSHQGQAEKGPEEEGRGPEEDLGVTAGEIQGRGVSRPAQRVEKGVPKEAEGGRPSGSCPGDQAHLPVLRGGVPELGHAQDWEEREVGLLREKGVPDEEGHRVSESPTGEAELAAAGPLKILTIDGWEEIESVEYAGVREVWDIETEKHHTFFANGIGVHNCQLMDPGLEDEVLEVLNDSDIKTALYTGTSTTVDTLLEARYQEGCQATWRILLDDKGERTIDCGDPAQVIPAIGEFGMVDPKTGNRINPLRGYYHFANPGALSEKLFSVHIPQVINPDIVFNALQWNTLWRAFQRNEEKAIQEKLGIPVESASREITESDLKNLCRPEVVGSPEERLRRARSGFYRMIVSGVDWGGSDYNVLRKTKISNTTHVIAGVTKTGQVHMLYFRRHGGMDYKTIMNLIANDHQRFRAGAIGTDFGVGETYHELMRSHPVFNNGRHIIFHYTGPRTPVCSVMSGALTGTLNLNRTETITAMLLAMTIADPIILCPAWEEVGEYLQDFLNIHRALADKQDQGGQRTFVYHRDASKTDDVVHSMNFTFSMIRLIYDQLLVSDDAARQILRAAILGAAGVTAPEGTLHAPSPQSQMMKEFLSSFDQDYESPEYQDWE